MYLYYGECPFLLVETLPGQAEKPAVHQHLASGMQ